MKSLLKFVIFIVISFTLASAVYYSYPYAKKYLSIYNAKYYEYEPENIPQSKIDTSKLDPAQAVPILLYHGIVNKEDKNNTDLKHFIDHMEMLKKEGYETISMSEFDLFLDGKYVLPPKPIIITFDDGRKDSYYPTDNILKKLGFKATIFVTTARVIDGDNFFLSWTELKRLKNSGRWEIEAHGRNSHDKIRQSENYEMGNYLSSRLYKEDGGLESIEDYENRVELDYQNGISDLRNYLRIDSKYYAIPLNEYEQKPIPNYPGYATFNNTMIKKYFKIALIQTVIGPEVQKNHRYVYNYRDVDRHLVARISPKNMDPNVLKSLLEDEAPVNANLRYVGDDLIKNIKSSYGQVKMFSDVLELRPNRDTPSTRVLYGDYHWSDYTVVAKITNMKGRSVVLMGYVNENNDSLSFGITDLGVFIRQTIDGKETQLRQSIILDNYKKGSPKNFKMEFNGKYVTCYIDSKIIFKNVKIDIKQGMVGIKAWDGKGNGLGVVNSLEVYPTLSK